MRVLFDLYYPGYLRYFDSTIAELAKREADVMVAFDLPGKQSEGLEALERLGPRVRVVKRPPKRADVWDPAAIELRRTVDYIRYWHPALADARFLRRRMQHLPRGLGFLAAIRRLPAPVMPAIFAVSRALESALPSSPDVERYLRKLKPDVVVVSPLVTQASRQTDLVKSARALGIPTLLSVASWDHLTTKGLIRILPDRIAVWNEVQRREAAELHGIDRERVTVTGAPPFDRWFVREPVAVRAAFARRVGLPDDRPFVLFVGSTASISGPDAEQRFVRRWAEALRASDDECMREVPILVRPHPYNVDHWREADLSEFGAAAVWPRGGANPVREVDRDDYFTSLVYSAAVVGINTSAMIEAAIVGVPVLSITPAEFVETQELTPHFHYLLPENGGFLNVATTLEDHVRQLADVVADPEPHRRRLDAFVGSFVRPQGVDRASTPILVDEIERLGAGAPSPAPRARLALAARPVLYLAGVAMTLADPARRARVRRRTPGLMRRRLRAVARARQVENR